MSLPTPIDTALVRKHDVRGPRYTSYPTAPQFSSGFDEQAYRVAAARPGAGTDPLSLYVHIPFCRTVCFYCGCNKIVTANYRRALRYLELLDREARLLGELHGSREVRQLHFGGGTPTYLRSEELRSLMKSLRTHFKLSDAPAREFSIEIDPRTVDATTLETLADLGFNRMSLGIQDFDPNVQRAVNRVQSFAQVAEVLAGARANGFRSTNFDLIYGLPRQTEASFRRTLDTVLRLKPERLAVYSYAHLPQLFKVQRNIHDAELPGADARLRLLELTISTLTQAGYVYIGMDHFALPTDELARSRLAGALHRNFQGYSTHSNCDIVGLGVSAISDLGVAYAQNAKDMERYAERIESDRLPIVHGIQLTVEDQLRRDVIQSVMCQGRVDRAAIERRHPISFAAHFASELERLAALVEDGLVTSDHSAVQVTERGQFFLRNIAMIFDAYTSAAGTPRFSKAI
jgi:oxygen-independent coproporphyrinogen-3 oxidase